MIRLIALNVIASAIATLPAFGQPPSCNGSNHGGVLYLENSSLTPLRHQDTVSSQGSLRLAYSVPGSRSGMLVVKMFRDGGPPNGSGDTIRVKRNAYSYVCGRRNI